jgi:hypothetical protein
MSALPPGAIRCHYADNPGLRPDRRLTATAQIGPIPLCPSCLQRRSTLGKGQPVRPLPAGQPAAGFDPLAWVTQAHTQLRTAEHNLAAAVLRARQHGHSWAANAERLGITRQAAQQRFREATMP